VRDDPNYSTVATRYYWERKEGEPGFVVFKDKQ
jgi:hypothetical protein